MLKAIKPGRKYILCNVDEHYAKDVYEVIKRGQMAKGPGAWPEGDISFEEWKKLTWPETVEGGAG